MKSHDEQNKKLAITLMQLVLSMVLLTFASVPIYSIFCKVTGFGGTTQRGENPGNKGTKTYTIKFDSNVDRDLPWKFYPKQHELQLKAGENILAFYYAKNESPRDINGMAIYNVTPLKAGKYFVKVHCFCFDEQLMQAGEESMMPVSFYIDPAIETDPDTQDVDTIILSYTFFRTENVTPEILEESIKNGYYQK